MVEEYIRKIKDFRESIEGMDTEVLAKYYSSLKPKNFIEHLCWFWHNSDKFMEYHETKRALLEREDYKSK